MNFHEKTLSMPSLSTHLSFMPWIPTEEGEEIIEFARMNNVTWRQMDRNESQLTSMVFKKKTQQPQNL